jgi:hypothetical protein
METEIILRERARTAIRAGKLPDCLPHRTWAGKGAGAVCAVCGAEVRAEEIEYELEFPRLETPAGGVGNYRFHVRCFDAWELERQSRNCDDRESADGRTSA